MVEQGVDLGGERTRKETLHGQGCPIRLLFVSIVGSLIVESSDGKQIHYLLVHFLLSIDHRAHHLLFISIHGRHLKIEFHLRCCWLSADIHQTVYAYGIVGERVADVQVREADAVDGIDGLQVEGSLIGITAEDDGAAPVESEVLLDDVLYGNPIGSVIDGIGTEHVEGALVMEGCPDATFTV